MSRVEALDFGGSQCLSLLRVSTLALHCLCLLLGSFRGSGRPGRLPFRDSAARLSPALYKACWLELCITELGGGPYGELDRGRHFVMIVVAQPDFSRTLN